MIFYAFGCLNLYAEKSGGASQHCRVSGSGFANIYDDVDGSVINQKKNASNQYDLWSGEYKRDKKGRLMVFLTGERQNVGWMYASDLKCK